MELFDRLFQPPPTPKLEPEPPFPLYTLPPAVRAYVTASAASVRVPPAMIAVPLLAFAGATIGNQLRIDIGNGWLERPVLWVALVALTGAGKSPAIRAARRPLDVIQAEAFATWQERMETWRATPEPRPTPHPVFDRLFTTDPTISALIEDLHHSRGIAIVRDELIGLVRAMSRRGGDERQKYLSLWSSEPIALSRTGDTGAWIPHPVVGIVGGMQPMLVHKLRSTYQDGFVERFLPIFVAVPPRYWNESTTGSVAPPDVAAMAALFRKLRRLRVAAGHPEGLLVRRTAGAGMIWGEWFNHNIDRSHDVKLPVRGFYHKLPGHVARLALILHALWQPDAPERPIDEETLGHAIALGEFFRTHIHRTIVMLGEFDPIPPPKPTLRHRILRTLAESTDSEGWVGRSEMQIAVGRPDMAEFDRIVDDLRREQVVEQRIFRGKPTGRPTVQFRAVRKGQA